MTFTHFILSNLPEPGPAPAQTPVYYSSPARRRPRWRARLSRCRLADWRPGEAQHHFDVRGGVHRGAVPGQDSIEARAERVDQLHMARRGLRSGGAETHLGINQGRDHDAVTAQHCLLQALQQRCRLLKHDERADAGVEHPALLHSSNRLSSLTTSSRSAINSGSALSSCTNELQVGRTGRRMMLSPSRTISSSLIPA